MQRKLNDERKKSRDFMFLFLCFGRHRSSLLFIDSILTFVDFENNFCAKSAIGMKVLVLFGSSLRILN